MNVFVAGATGALGVPLVRQLVAKGHRVTGLTRSPAKASMLRDLGATPAIADVLDGTALKGVIAEAAPEGVIHALTALPKTGPKRASHLTETNRLRTTGTANLLSAATAAGARRFVAESIVLVYGGTTGQRRATESDEVIRRSPVEQMQPALDAIHSLEKQVLGANAAGHIEGIVLRYGLFYGPGVASTEYMKRLLRFGVPMLPAGGNSVVSWIHMEDAASLTIAALERGPAGAIYNVVDDEPVALRDLAAAMSAATGGRKPRSIPLWLVRLVAPIMVASASTSLAVSNEKAKRELGWEPAYPTYREGVNTLRRS